MFFLFIFFFYFVFFFKQKTAYEMRISDWSSDVCSSDLQAAIFRRSGRYDWSLSLDHCQFAQRPQGLQFDGSLLVLQIMAQPPTFASNLNAASGRSEEHTSDLQSLMRISYAVFCLKKKKTKTNNKTHLHTKEKTTSTNLK